jgi:hypothetical protein
MAISLKHTTQAVGTNAGNGEIAKEEWNEEHTLTAATNTLLGRSTAGTGAVEEITCTAAGRAILDDADAAAQRTTLGLGTGDSPQFTAVNIGNASDTTVTRVSAGRIAVEGVNVALETDVEGKQTIWVPAAAIYSRTTTGASIGTIETTTNKIILRTLDFDTATQEFAQFAIQMPKSWNESTLICQFIWSHPATTTNFGVAWEIQAVAFADDDAADTAFGTAVTVTDTGGTTNDIYISAESSAMTVAGTPAAQEYVVFQVRRAPANASDTLAVDARLHGVKIHYTTDAAKDD